MDSQTTNLITLQRLNKQLPLQADRSKVVHLTAMDAQGNPCKVTIEQLQVNPTDFNQAVLDKLNENLDVAEDVHTLDKHVGIYAKHQPVTLTPYATGKMLTAINGMVSEVKQTGWGISRLTPEQFTFGDTVLLKMVDGAGQNLMVEGAVLFAKKEGGEFFDLMEKGDMALPESGEVSMVIAEDVPELYVSHPLSVSALTVCRSGMGEEIAKARMAHGLVVHEGLLCMEVEQDEDE